MDPLKPVRDDFVRARRNLVLMCAFIFVHWSGAIHFKEDNQLLGFNVAVTEQKLLMIWCGIFLLYFFWRFYTAGGGVRTLDTFTSSYKAAVYNTICNHAYATFLRKFKDASVRKEHILRAGEIKKIPVVGLSPDGSSFVLHIEQKSQLRNYHYYPSIIKYWLIRIYCLIREAIGDNQFSELVLPWILFILAAGAAGQKIFFTTYALLPPPCLP